MTFFPWYAIFFAWDDEMRPKYMQYVARLYMDALMNIPVISLTFMVTPGFINGALLTMAVFPYAIIPYIVLLVVPVLGSLAIWGRFSLLHAIAHGIGNWWML